MEQQKINMGSIQEELMSTKIANESLSWTFKSKEEKEKMLTEIGNVVAKNYLNQRAEHAEYKPLQTDIKFYLDGMHGGCAGYDVLLQHSSVLDKNSAIQLMAHESTHHAQYLFKLQDFSTLSQENQNRQRALQANDYYHDSVVFGIKTGGPAYFQGSDGGLYHKLKCAFYNICPVEREAREAEIAIAKQLGFKDWTQKTDIDPSVKMLKTRYMCQDYTEDQVFSLLDQAIVNVAIGAKPMDVREASITYDYAALLYGQGDVKGQVESMKMMMPGNKYRALADAGYDQSDPIMQKLAHFANIKEYQPQPVALDELFRDDNRDGGNWWAEEWKQTAIQQGQENWGRIVQGECQENILELNEAAHEENEIDLEQLDSVGNHEIELEALEPDINIEGLFEENKFDVVEIVPDNQFMMSVNEIEDVVEEIAGPILGE